MGALVGQHLEQQSSNPLMCHDAPERLISQHHSMVSIRPMSFVVMLIFQEKVFKPAIEREGDGCDAQAGKSALETVPPREGACISPFFPERR